jgi:hypothetical protein
VGTSPTVSVSGLLFGFLFAGFWWSLNRELSFKEEERHFKLGYILLLLTMAVLAALGILAPLRAYAAASHDRVAVLSYRGIVVALVAVFGYMLTEMGHYAIFQRPKYITRFEWFFFGVTILVALILAVRWSWQR